MELLHQHRCFSVPSSLRIATVALFLLAPILAHQLAVHSHRFDIFAVQAAGSPAGLSSVETAAPTVPGSAAITVDYPEDGSIFPPEITPPTFIWHDADSFAVKWRIDVTYAANSEAVHAVSSGERIQQGEIDPRAVSRSNELPALTPEQATAHTWIPSAESWALIKHSSVQYAAIFTATGLDASGHPVSQGRVAFTTSKDPVGAPIFYRDVPLMPDKGEKDVVQPLAPSALHLINWRIRDLAQPSSRIVLQEMHTCANCHSFSANGKTMGMDVDGPDNDHGLYALVPVQKQMSIRNQDVISWNSDLRVGKSRVGFMSQVSPDGQYVLSTFAGKDQSMPSAYYVTNFNDYHFLQVFYPTRGILAYYSKATGRRVPLPGADDPRYVQTDGVWSLDGKYIVFARAEAKDSHPQGQKPALAANDPNEVQIQYSLFRIPFNGGKGGVAEPVLGASDNGMSNNFPKISPDGRWIVFVKCRNGQLMRPDSHLYIVPFKGGVARRMRCNTSLMNSWHSFSPNGRWMVFSSKSRSPYTQLYLTHIDENGNDSPPIYIDNAKAANRAVNIPEFVNIPTDGIQKIDVPAADFYRIMDEALVLQNKGDHPGALAKWQQALAMEPDDARANNSTGIALAVVGKPEEAISHLQKAVQANPNFAEAYFNLGFALMNAKHLDEAIDAWLNAVRIRPQFAEAHQNLGYAFYVQQKYSDSLDHLHSALEAEPDDVFALNLAATEMATCPDESARYGRGAVILAEHAKLVTNGRSASVLDTLSAAYAEDGRFADAIATEQQALSIATQQGNTSFVAMLGAHLSAYADNHPLRVMPGK
jgi:tetratricopeptide (TPR) repeat protein